MADRYWVGGTGTWSSTNTVNWAASSGGASGASVPTAADNVFFDVNSNVGTGAFTVTMANTPRVCNDFTASGLDGAMTLAGTSIGLTVSGSMSVPATNFTRTYTGTTTFNATTTGKTVTSNGIAFSGPVTFNGVGGAWTLGSAITVSGTNLLTLTNGTFDTSVSNYSVTAGGIATTNSNTRTLNLNASTVTLSSIAPFTATTSTNLTLNAGTSSIVCSTTNGTFAGGSKTFYNVSFTSTAITGISVTGTNTFNNLSITGRTSVGIGSVTFSSNQTINGTLTLGAGTSAAYRTFIRGNYLTQTTLTCAAISSVTDYDFRDIRFAGAISLPVTGTRLGDCGGNANITFPAPKTVYYGQTGSNSWGTASPGSWSATSGGALDATMFPLAQDTAVFPAATYPASGSTTTLNANYNIGTIDMSFRTSNTMMFTASTGLDFIVHGDWITGSGITLGATTASINFLGRSNNQLITSAGKTFPFSYVLVQKNSGSFQLQDNFTLLATNTFYFYQGTLDLNSLTLSTGIFNSNISNTRVFAFGTGNITCTYSATSGITCFDMTTSVNHTYTGTPTINISSSLTSASSLVVLPPTTYTGSEFNYNITSGSYAIYLPNSVSNGYIKNLNFTGFSGTFVLYGYLFVTGDLTLSSGTSLSYTFSTNQLIFNPPASTTQLITTAGKTIPFVVYFYGSSLTGVSRLQDAFTTSTNATYLQSGTLDLNGKTFTAAVSFNTYIGTKNLTFNGGTLVCSANTTTAFNNAYPTGFTSTSGVGTGTISMAGSGAKTFVGGGSTYNCTLNQGGAGALTISGSNTFLNITNTVQPATVLFTAGTTNKFTNFSLSGTAGNLITLGSTSTSQATLQKGSTWYMGANSTNGGNNTGLTFTAGGGIDYLSVSYINGTVVASGTGQFLAFF
jgi:hypothetical protein